MFLLNVLLRSNPADAYDCVSGNHIYASAGKLYVEEFRENDTGFMFLIRPADHAFYDHATQTLIYEEDGILKNHDTEEVWASVGIHEQWGLSNGIRIGDTFHILAYNQDDKIFWLLKDDEENAGEKKWEQLSHVSAVPPNIATITANPTTGAGMVMAFDQPDNIDFYSIDIDVEDNRIKLTKVGDTYPYILQPGSTHTVHGGGMYLNYKGEIAITTSTTNSDFEWVWDYRAFTSYEDGAFVHVYPEEFDTYKFSGPDVAPVPHERSVIISCDVTFTDDNVLVAAATTEAVTGDTVTFPDCYSDCVPFGEKCRCHLRNDC